MTTGTLGHRLEMLWVDDEPMLLESLTDVLRTADIQVHSVTNGTAALEYLEHVHSLKLPLDIIVTDNLHPGLRGPDLIRHIRDFPDEMTLQGGLRIRHLPIVLFSGSAHIAKQELENMGLDVPVLYKPTRIEELVRAIDEAVREYRERILSDLHNVGVAIQFEGGRFTLRNCYTVEGEGGGYESKYIDASTTDGPRRAAEAYRRLVLVADRHVVAERAILEFESLLNREGCTEADFQRFFRLHPEFLYQGLHIEHWAEPYLQDQSTGRIYKPDFILKSMFLPTRPWSWQIVDLKRPDVPVITNAHFYATLSQQVHKVVAQLRSYSEYFDNPANAEAIASRFGGVVRKPNLVAVIGHLPKEGLLEEYAKLRSQILDVALMTYSEILEFRRANLEWRSTLGIL